MTTVLIVDDHPLVREGVGVVLGLEPGITAVHQTGTFDDAIEAAGELRPDIALLDVRLKGASGVDLCARLVDERLVGTVIGFSVHGSEGVVRSMFSAGARGFVLKTSGSEVLREAVRSVLGGERYVDPAVRFDPFRRKTAKRPFGLTDQEANIIRNARSGLTPRQIGEKLGISEGTVKTHLRRARWKTGARDRTELLALPVDPEDPAG